MEREQFPKKKQVFAFEDKFHMYIEEINNENLHNFLTLIKAQQDGISEKLVYTYF